MIDRETGHPVPKSWMNALPEYNDFGDEVYGVYFNNRCLCVGKSLEDAWNKAAIILMNYAGEAYGLSLERDNIIPFPIRDD